MLIHLRDFNLDIIRQIRQNRQICKLSLNFGKPQNKLKKTPEYASNIKDE